MANEREDEVVTDDKIDPFNEVAVAAYKLFLDDRIILLNGDIKENVIEKVVVPMIKFSKENPKLPITLTINSYGGSADDAMAVVDVMQFLKTPITTVVFGKAMSAAFDIFLAGDYRIVHANSILMCHSGAETLGVKPLPFISDVAAFNEQLFKRWAQYYAKRSKISYDKWYKIIKSGRDRYFFPEEALQAGIAHEIRQPAGKFLDTNAAPQSKPKAKSRKKKR